MLSLFSIEEIALGAALRYRYSYTRISSVMDDFGYGTEGLQFSRVSSSPLEFRDPLLQSADNAICNSDQLKKIIEKGSGWNKSDDIVVKKLSHNAKERYRRQKLNALYAKLQSVFPHSSTKTKKQITKTAIVRGALRYVSQLRRLIQTLSRQRDELMTLKSISEGAASDTSKMLINEVKFNKFPHATSTEVRIFAAGPGLLITVQTTHADPVLFSRLFLLLEEEKLDVINASTFVSGDKAWHNIQVKAMESSSRFDTSGLRLKILHLGEQSGVPSLK